MTAVPTRAAGASPASGTTHDPAPPRAGRAAGRVLLVRVAAYLTFALVILYFAIAARGFLTPLNLTNVVEQSAVLGLLAFGMTAVVIGGGSNVVSGGIDLSLAANVGLSGAVLAVALKAGYPPAAAVAMTLGTGLVIGAVNALAVVALGVLPLLATLAVMNVCAGTELVLTENTVITVDSPLTDFLSTASFLGISALAWSLVLATALFALLLQYSRWGLRLHAVGAYPDAARAAGLPVTRYMVASYLISGLCGSAAAILYVSRLSSSTPGAGDMLLSIIVTTLMGVVFSRRLVPSVGGTLLSVLFIGLLINGFQLVNVSSYWVNGVQGFLILLVVSMTSLTRRGRQS